MLIIKQNLTELVDAAHENQSINKHPHIYCKLQKPQKHKWKIPKAKQFKLFLFVLYWHCSVLFPSQMRADLHSRVNTNITVLFMDLDKGAERLLCSCKTVLTLSQEIQSNIQNHKHYGKDGKQSHHYYLKIIYNTVIKLLRHKNMAAYVVVCHSASSTYTGDQKWMLCITI